MGIAIPTSLNLVELEEFVIRMKWIFDFEVIVLCFLGAKDLWLIGERI